MKTLDEWIIDFCRLIIQTELVTRIVQNLGDIQKWTSIKLRCDSIFLCANSDLEGICIMIIYVHRNPEGSLIVLFIARSFIFVFNTETISESKRQLRFYKHPEIFFVWVCGS